jgi:MFS family permease
MSLLIPSTTLSYINQELGPSPYYSWITIVWQLGGSIIVSISGRLSDIFGRRYFMITGASISIVGCLVGANGKSIDMMIVSGTLFGIGSGFQEMAYACIQEMLPNKHRMVGVGKCHSLFHGWF